MYPDLAFHPLSADAFPRSSVSGGEGIGVPVDPATGRGVQPRSGDFDAFETRTYNGLSGAELSEHATDIYNMLNDGPRHEGVAERAYARMEGIMATAVWAYIVVKNALGLLVKPLRPKMSEMREASVRGRRTPQAPTVWLTKAPTESEWDARDALAGYDLRGTSPTWVKRRVYQHRASRRRALELPHERAERLVKRKAASTTPNSEFIGPPTPRHYKMVEDMGMIWPPVPRPTAPKGTLPSVAEAAFITEDVREAMSPESIEEADSLIEGYNYALEQFGADATFNYLRGLRDVETNFMDAYISAYNWAFNRAFNEFAASERAPP